MRALLETLRKETVSAPDFLAHLACNLFRQSHPGPAIQFHKISTVRDASQFKDWCDFSLLPPAGRADQALQFFRLGRRFHPRRIQAQLLHPAPPKN